jgi:hypothetical protein
MTVQETEEQLEKRYLLIMKVQPSRINLNKQRKLSFLLLHMSVSTETGHYHVHQEACYDLELYGEVITESRSQ